MATDSDRDVRQLRQMLECVGAVREGRVTLVNASDTLIFLRDSLEVANEEWLGAFTSHVATLESAGLATNEQKAGMGTSFDVVVAESLCSLEELIGAHPSAEALHVAARADA